MVKSMRQSTLEELGLGTVFDIFKNGRLPVSAEEMVDRVFGKAGDRGSMVISGASGIVGAGKAMQFSSRLAPYDVPVIALDFPGVPDGIGMQYKGLAASFGKKNAAAIMKNIISMNYDGENLPGELSKYKPKFLLEAIPEILEIKKAHFQMFRKAYPGIDISSVTSGFPSAKLGVSVAHPAFPHQINKIFEVVEKKDSNFTHLLWSLGLIPLKVSDDWSFVLDVLFCGLMLAGLRYHEASNMPFWKIDKIIRKHFGPNPFRAHDVIGAGGANFLTWSCLHHLSKHYGGLFTPTAELDERKDYTQDWYPLNHFRPLVNWTVDEKDTEEFRTWILGPLCQMTSIMLHEKRGHFASINAVGEVCAQFRTGILSQIRALGREEVLRIVKKYQKMHPAAAKSKWFPAVYKTMDTPEWQQLYVNAEYDKEIGVITISRESYNKDVDAELNRAIDWLKKKNVKRVIVTGDFHLSTQMVGAETSDFYPALEDEKEGINLATSWSHTARRLQNDFQVTVGFINGKRCMGGFLELLMHCHYLISDKDANLAMPEVTLPVVPGMEGCHWPFRKAAPTDYPKLIKLLLEGTPVKAKDAQGWLVDYAGPMETALQKTWEIMTDGKHGLKMRPLVKTPLTGVPKEPGRLSKSEDPAMDIARKAIFESMAASCKASLADAINLNAKHSAGFMTSKSCLKGRVGMEYMKTTQV